MGVGDGSIDSTSVGDEGNSDDGVSDCSVEEPDVQPARLTKSATAVTALQHR